MAAFLSRRAVTGDTGHCVPARPSPEKSQVQACVVVLLSQCPLADEKQSLWIRKEEKQRRLDPHRPRDRLGLSHPQAANVKGEMRREIPGGGWVSRTGSHVAPRHRGRRTPLVIRTPQPGLGGGWLLTAEGNFLSEAWSGLAGCSELVAGSPARIEPAIRRACLSV